ncbi:pentapeptide repeat-containing protein [Amycolatopsis sp. NPDC004169]|uniref:pentapeptide repeat-containing protein n=1 Tax=Amycolatopsis sp. NPDC004169 TaxID=3154453 RepID=UPI0033BA71F1
MIVLGVSTVLLLLDAALRQLPDQQWWPGWAAIGAWLGRWWPLLLALVLAAATATLIRHGSPRPTVIPPMSIRWESEPGQPGLLPRATVTPDVTPPPRRWNWTAITSVVTAATALAALGFTAQSLSATRTQINLSEQGQITDRYTKAVDQLGTQGADHLQTRLGGIYALERLARDSPRDQATIIEILSAFIRSTLPTATGKPDGTTTCASSTNVQIDVRAALSVLGRRNHDNDADTIADLRGVCLTGADLAYVNFGGANLFEADFTNANLIGAQLERANLYRTHFAGAQLDGAHLDHAYLASANLAGMRLIVTQLNGANLTNANLSHSDLDGAGLAHADLSYANLTDARLFEANLSGAYLAYAQLGGTTLTEAHLSHADLAHAILNGTQATRADLADANLTDANLRHANLTDAHLTHANLSQADLDLADLTRADLTGALHDDRTFTLGATTTGTVGAWF